MPKSSITDATTKIHAILEPLESDERHRVINAALILLGDELASSKLKSGNDRIADTEEDESDDTGELPVAATRWLKKHALDITTLEHYFHFDEGKVEPIQLPDCGKSRREKTITTYLMQGVAALLQDGSATFTDSDAREQCDQFGCYDSPNHGKYLKNFGNRITGSKSNGWRLTTPGLTAAANLLKPTEE